MSSNGSERSDKGQLASFRRNLWTAETKHRRSEPNDGIRMREIFFRVTHNSSLRIMFKGRRRNSSSERTKDQSKPYLVSSIVHQPATSGSSGTVSHRFYVPLANFVARYRSKEAGMQLLKKSKNVNIQFNSFQH